MIKYLSLFSGIGAFEQALHNLNIEYELAGFSEIDKYAAKSYQILHGHTNNLGDITKIDEKKLPQDLDLITYGFPCQDVSVAGKGKGAFNDDGTLTRSGLFYEAARIINHCNPKVAIAENVKGLTGKKHKDFFTDVLNTLEDAGYNNYWQILNAKDYEVPQNRERVFIVSIRKDIDTGIFEFPQSVPLKLRLKDILEPVVDEKYYMKDDKIKPLLKNLICNDVEPFNPMPDGTCRTIKNQYFKNSQANFIKQTDQGATCAVVNTDDVRQIGNCMPTKTRENPNQGRIYDTHGCSPALNAMTGGGRQPMVLTVGNVNPSGKGQNGQVIDSLGIARTVTVEKGEGQKVMVVGRINSSQDGIVVDPNGLSPTHTAGHANTPKVLEPVITRCIGRNPDNPSDRTAGVHTEQRLEVNSQGLCNTITTVQKDNYVLESQVLSPKRTEYGKRIRKQYESGEIQESRHNMITLEPRSDGISNTLTTVVKDNMLLTHNYRIRKLTPLECLGRLMAFGDDAVHLLSSNGISNTQLYKQAGNSIVVTVLEYLFCQIFDSDGEIWV